MRQQKVACRPKWIEGALAKLRSDAYCPFAFTAATDLQRLRVRERRWRSAEPTKPDEVEETGKTYWLVDVGVAVGTRGRHRTTGLLILDQHGRHTHTAALQCAEQRLPRVMSREDVQKTMDGRRVKIGQEYVTFSRNRLLVDDELVWQSCVESRSELLPFYVVRQSHGGREVTAYVRVDGRVCPRFRRGLAGG